MKRRILISPNTYVQGEGVIEEAGAYLTKWCESPFIVGGSTALSVVEEPLRTSLKKEGLTISGMVSDVKRCTEKKVFSIIEDVKTGRADLIIGVGGGAAVDAAKAAAYKLNLAVATIPTVASTNADCSAVSVIYDENGRYTGRIRSHANPVVVLVDTRVLASAPPQYLVSGMGDALSCRFEAEACARSGSKNHAGGYQLDTLLTIVNLCYDTLMSKGLQALSDVKEKRVTPYVESVIEAIKFQSTLGFESGGNAAAHAIHNGFTRASEVKGSHGEIVAFSVIAQLFLEDKSLALIELIAQWCHNLGLPTTLSELSVSDNCVEAVSEETCSPGSSIKNEPFPVVPHDVSTAIRAADRLGTRISHRE
jgi:glycerol dehydrogenase